MIYGQDWASYQGSDPSADGLDFAFAKITEGLTYVNPEWQSQRNDAKSAGLVWGGYHYPHMGNSVQSEADHFLSQVDWKPGDIAVLDWEGYDQANSSIPKANQAAFKDAWLKYVKSKLPHNPVGVYCDTEYWLYVDETSFCQDFLWIADYTTAGNPRIQHPWTFHQYGSSGVDRDVANFPDRAALRAWTLSFAPAPTAPPIAPPEEEMPQQLVGTVTPGPDPITVLPPAGTAWSAYPNRRLHLGFDKINDATATATVRAAVHDGTKWREEVNVTVTAAGGRVDVDLAASDVKVSLQTSSAGVGYAIEVW